MQDAPVRGIAGGDQCRDVRDAGARPRSEGLAEPPAAETSSQSETPGKLSSTQSACPIDNTCDTDPMAGIDPSLFYTGLVAELYAPLRSVTPDPEPYARFIARWGEPALELGCGDGDPLLELRARGLDVDGLDSSPDMLARCRRAAATRGVDVVLQQQSMQTMELGRRYRSIYIADRRSTSCPTTRAQQARLLRSGGISTRRRRAHSLDDSRADADRCARPTSGPDE